MRGSLGLGNCVSKLSGWWSLGRNRTEYVEPELGSKTLLMSVLGASLRSLLAGTSGQP